MPLKSLRVQRVALASDRVVLGRRAARTPRRGTARATRTPRSRASRASRGGDGSAESPKPRRVVLVDQRVEERAGRRGRRRPRCRPACVHATAWRRAATIPCCRALGERGLDAREPLGHERHALGDRLPVSSVSRAMRSNAMRTVCTGLPRTRRSRRRSPASCSSSASSSRSRMHLGGDAVGVGLAIVGGVERAQRGAVVLGALVGAVGGEVGHLVVVAGDALTGRAQRIERGEPLDVVSASSYTGGLVLITRAPVRERLRSRGTVGPAGCHTRGAASRRRRPTRPGSTDLRRRAPPTAIDPSTVSGTGSASNAHDGRLPPGGCTTIRIARAGAERVRRTGRAARARATSSVAGQRLDVGASCASAPAAGRSTPRRRARAGCARSHPLCT